MNQEEFKNDLKNFKEKISPLMEKAEQIKIGTWDIFEEFKHLFTVGNTNISSKTTELIKKVLNEFPVCNKLIEIALELNPKKLDIELEEKRISDFKIEIFALRGEILHYLDSEIIFSEPIKKGYQEVD